MQQTKPQALTPDEAAEVMDQKSHTAKPLEPKTPEQSAKAKTEPFYFYNVVVTVQKRSDKCDKFGRRLQYKPHKFKCLINTNAYSKIKPAVLRYFDKWLDSQDAYIKNYDIRKMDVDCLIPKP